MSVDLSVAIIFKNEIRCLERCLKSLQPLRERLSLEIVMADTGSDDGSRAVAERYADAVFDFPWINDFAAARNAVLERCTGEWVLVLDCDEWLDKDVDALAAFVCDRDRQDVSAVLEIRNYTFADLNRYSSFYALRLLRLSARPRYVGAIHEQPRFEDADARDKEAQILRTPVLHHDGYVMLNDDSEAGRAKRVRNLELLREELAREPEDLRTLKEIIEIADEEPDLEELICRAVDVIKRKKGDWDKFGPAILRTAVSTGAKKRLPEFKEWAALAEELFPESNLTKIDVNYLMFYATLREGETEECIRRGEDYLRAYRRNKRGGKVDLSSVWYGVLQAGSEASAQEVRISLARQYAAQNNHELAYARLREADYSALDGVTARRALRTAAWLYANTDLETELLIRALWDGICEEKPNERAMLARLQAFFEEAYSLFNIPRAPTEKRPAWGLFLPLAGRCIVGDAAALMAAQTSEEADGVLARIDNAASLPPAAFIHALKLGAAFPVPGRPLTVEDADAAAARLTPDKQFLREAAIFSASAAEDEQDIIWARALCLAALQSVDWETEPDPREPIFALVRAESLYLSRCAVRPEEENAPMHRFARRLANACAVLFPASVAPEFAPDVSGGVRGALAEIKEAVVAAPGQKKAVDRLLDEIMKEER